MSVCPAAGDLIVLHRLGCSEKPGIQRGRALKFLHYFLPLLDTFLYQ